jgi:hypothetical protein
MSSASLELKEFKALFPRMVRALEKVTGRKKPEEIEAILLFPTIRSTFRDDPEYCRHVANGEVGIGTWNRAKTLIPDGADDIVFTDEMITQLRPLMMELAQIFYKNMGEAERK